MFDQLRIVLLLTGSDERLEFDSNVKKVHAPTRDGKERRLAKEPAIRKILLLAHQINRMIEEGKIKHPREVCPWILISKTRIDQVMNTLFLCPKIQESILSDDNPAIISIKEFNIRDLAKITTWDEQLDLWQQLLSGS